MAVRPSISMDERKIRGEDDLTHKLADIIKANATLIKYESENAPAHVLSEFEGILDLNISPGSISCCDLYG